MDVRFAQSARKHRVGRGSVWYVLDNVTPVPHVSARGEPGWRYVGPDERGRELEVVLVDMPATEQMPEHLLVIHVMPTALRRKP